MQGGMEVRVDKHCNNNEGTHYPNNNMEPVEKVKKKVFTLSQSIRRLIYKMYMVIGFFPLLVLIILVLYVIKSLLGIDIFPNMHFFGLLD
jgi:hypothetical protein